MKPGPDSISCCTQGPSEIHHIVGSSGPTMHHTHCSPTTSRTNQHPIRIKHGRRSYHQSWFLHYWSSFRNHQIGITQLRCNALLNVHHIPGEKNTDADNLRRGRTSSFSTQSQSQHHFWHHAFPKVHQQFRSMGRWHSSWCQISFFFGFWFAPSPLSPSLPFSLPSSPVLSSVSPLWSLKIPLLFRSHLPRAQWGLSLL